MFAAEERTRTGVTSGTLHGSRGRKEHPPTPRCYCRRWRWGSNHMGIVGIICLLHIHSSCSMLNTKIQSHPVRHSLAPLKPSSPMLSPLAPSLPSFQSSNRPFPIGHKGGPRPARHSTAHGGPVTERGLVTSRVTSRGRPPLFYPASSSDAVMARCTILE